MNVPLVVATASAVLGMSVAPAYELATHARITDQAIRRSELATNPEILLNLGLTKGIETTVSRWYYDVKGSRASIRAQQRFDFDQGKMPAMPGISMEDMVSTILGWTMQGAVREDDSAWLTGQANRFVFRAQIEPFDDPYGTFNRWCNHFFDPYRNREFVPSGSTTLQFCYGDIRGSAPVWATGFLGPFDALFNPREDVDRRNHFTVLDAREAMWRALTGYDKTMTSTVARDKPNRDGYWATAFRALGDVLHLNQDMAQPQHTRNEDHGAGPAAWYEKYTDGRAKAQTNFTYNWRIGELRAFNAPPLTYGDYGPIPSFRTYAHYWSSGAGSASLTGTGLADYSSRGFLTPARSIGNAEYPMPSADPAEYTRTTISNDSGFKAEYLLNRVRDTYLGGDSGLIKAVRRSIWGNTLAAPGSSNTGGMYGFDERVYDDRAALLIPRAVSYSAGLLNHFFRGRLEIGMPDTGFFAIRDQSLSNAIDSASQASPEQQGFTKIKVRLKNTTAPITPRDESPVVQPMAQGKLVAVIKYRRNTCNLSSAWPSDPVGARNCISPEEEIVVSKPVEITDAAPIPMATQEQPEGAEYPFDFTSAPLPASAWNISLQVVYRGKLGDEPDAVVVATKDISEPAFMTFMNATDYFTVNGKFYNQQTIAQNPDVFASVRQECVDRTTATYRIYDECFNRPDHFFVRAGTSQVTIAATGENAVSPRHLIRVAFLADLEKPVLLNWSPGEIRCDLPDRPLTVPAYRAQVGADDMWNYSLPNPMRGVRGWRNYFCYEDLGIVPTPHEVVETITAQLDPLTADEAKPMPVVISGW